MRIKMRRRQPHVQEGQEARLEKRGAEEAARDDNNRVKDSNAKKDKTDNKGNNVNEGNRANKRMNDNIDQANKGQ